MSIFGVIKEVKLDHNHDNGLAEVVLTVHDSRFPKGEEYPFGNQIARIMVENYDGIQKEMPISCNSSHCWIDNQLKVERYSHWKIRTGGGD